MRVFLSINLPDDVKREILDIQKQIDQLGLIKGKFTDLDNLHLTLKFLGEISDTELRAIKERVNKIKFKPFHLNINELGVFSEDSIRIIWVGINGDDIFLLQKKIDEALSDLFPKEYRFMSHITIARPKFVEDKQILLDEIKKIGFDKKKFFVDKIHLNESQISKYGAKYNSLMEIPLLEELPTIAN